MLHIGQILQRVSAHVGPREGGEDVEFLVVVTDLQRIEEIRSKLGDDEFAGLPDLPGTQLMTEKEYRDFVDR